MADFLTHLFLPLTVVYLVWSDRFQSPLYLSVGVFGLLADFDKVLGQPGLLHSLLTLIPIAVVLLLLEESTREDLNMAPIVTVLIFSHLLLDFLLGGPVPLLYPVIDQGIGLQYPAKTVFGSGLVGFTIDGPLVALRTEAPRPGFNTYGFITGYGVASIILFAIVYMVMNKEPTRSGF